MICWTNMPSNIFFYQFFNDNRYANIENCSNEKVSDIFGSSFLENIKLIQSQRNHIKKKKKTNFI